MEKLPYQYLQQVQFLLFHQDKHQLNFDTCETDAELRSSAERVLSSLSGEELRKLLLFTNGKTDYLYTDNNGVTVELT